MKVKELARRTGIPARKVRYYSQEGLIASTREDNNYREFSDRDALDLYTAQMRRSYDIPVAQLGKQADTMEWVEFRITELEQEIRAYQEKLDRLKVLRQFGLMFKGDLGKTEPTVPRVSYNIWNLGENIELDEKDEEELEILAGDMPYSYVAIRISGESLSDPEREPEVSLGLGMLKNVAEQRGHEFNRKKCESEVFTGYHITLISYDPFHITREELKPLLDRLEQEGTKLKSDLIGRIVFSEQTERGTGYFLLIGAEIG